MNGGEEGGEHYIAHKCDYLQFEVHVRKASFLSECLNIFATGCSIHSVLILPQRFVHVMHAHIVNESVLI